MAEPAKGSRNLLARAAVGLACGALCGLVAKDLNMHALVSYWKPRAPVVAGIAFLFMLLWMTPVRKALIAITASAIALWAVAAFTPLTRALLPRVVRADELP